jgi:CRP-like cAMP-binding protein
MFISFLLLDHKQQHTLANNQQRYTGTFKQVQQQYLVVHYPRGKSYFYRNAFPIPMKEFITFIRSLIGIDDLDLQLVLSKCQTRQIPKGKLILRKGQIANQYFFIVSGGVRFFYTLNDQETTTWVTFKNEFLTEISSLHLQKPSRFNIEVIEDSELIVIDKKDMDFLYGHIAVWEEFGRKIWEAMSVRMIDQILNFQTLTAEERYLEFMSNPEIIQKIPVKQLAAVLGITPNALSRIRKNIR